MSTTTVTSVRRGKIKVMNKRSGTYIQEELNGAMRTFTQPQWAKELEKRSKLTEEKWAEMSGIVVEEEEDNEPVVAGAKGKKSAPKAKGKKSTQKPVVKTNTDATLIEDDEEEDSDEIKA